MQSHSSGDTESLSSHMHNLSLYGVNAASPPTPNSKTRSTTDQFTATKSTQIIYRALVHVFASMLPQIVPMSYQIPSSLHDHHYTTPSTILLYFYYMKIWFITINEPSFLEGGPILASRAGLISRCTLSRTTVRSRANPGENTVLAFDSVTLEDAVDSVGLGWAHDEGGGGDDDGMELCNYENLSNATDTSFNVYERKMTTNLGHRAS
ncbi:hypothetical protein BJ165DRAFT_1547130 [Panaeolus papilionaceus]|nr:hypothetical protein BJ165DRAFT_1547130 [Panaeolus papilionaceus]